MPQPDALDRHLAVAYRVMMELGHTMDSGTIVLDEKTEKILGDSS